MFNKIKQLFTRKKPKEGYPYLNGRSFIICTVWVEGYPHSIPAIYDEEKELFLIETSIFKINSDNITYWEYTKVVSEKPQRISRKDQKIFFNQNVKEFKYEY